jgi:hypothetical protein
VHESTGGRVHLFGPLREQLLVLVEAVLAVRRMLRERLNAKAGPTRCPDNSAVLGNGTELPKPVVKEVSQSTETALVDRPTRPLFVKESLLGRPNALKQTELDVTR